MTTSGSYKYDIDGQETFFAEGPPTGAEIKQRMSKPNTMVQWQAQDGEWYDLRDDEPVPHGVTKLKLLPRHEQGLERK